MPTREYTVNLPLEPLRVGDWIERARWPLHVTVVGNFEAEPAAVDVLAAIVRSTAAAIDPPSARIGAAALFGPEGDIPVQLVESDDLTRLHAMLLDAFAARTTVVPVVPAHTREGYRPHLAHGELQLGAPLDLRSLALVEIGPDGIDSVAAVVATNEIGPRTAQEAMTPERAAAIWSDLMDAGLRSWVIGGWGIDALLGRATRAHHDLDLFVLDEQLPEVLEHLDRMGFALRSLWAENRWHRGLPSAFVAESGAGEELDVHVVGLEGDRVLPRSEHSITLPVGALDGAGTIAGVRVTCATAEAQVVMHSGYDVPEHQREDLALLAARPS